MTTPADPAYFTIKTFTLVGDFDEDRLRLNACDAAGLTQSIALTRRLLDRAVPAMAKEIESRAEGGPVPAELILPIAQQRLRRDRQDNPVPPVQTAPDAAPWLCTAMQFAPKEEGVVWILKGRGNEEARMFLSHRNLQATLDVFATRYRAMEWSTLPFPEWLMESATSPRPAAAVLH